MVPEIPNLGIDIAKQGPMGKKYLGVGCLFGRRRDLRKEGVELVGLATRKSIIWENIK